MAIEATDFETFLIEQQLRIQARFRHASQRVQRERIRQQRMRRETLQDMTITVIGQNVRGEAHPGKRPIPTAMDDDWQTR